MHRLLHACGCGDDSSVCCQRHFHLLKLFKSGNLIVVWPCDLLGEVGIFSQPCTEYNLRNWLR